MKSCWRLLVGVAVFINITVISPMCHAANSSLAQFDRPTIELALLALLGLAGLLFILVIIDKFRLSKKQRELNSVQLDNQAQSTLLDSTNSGIVHLNHAGEIVYVNKVAAYFLGNSKEHFKHKSLVSVFDEKYQAAIEKVINGKVASKLQLVSSLKGRVLMLDFAPLPPSFDTVASILSIYEVSDLQATIDQCKAELALSEQLFDASQLAKVFVDFEAKQFNGDEGFARLLESSDNQISGDIKQFTQLLNHSDLLHWNQALETLKHKDKAEFKCRLELPQGKLLVKVFAQSYKRNEKSEVATMWLTLQNLAELAEQQSQTLLFKQQLKSLLSSNPHPMYILDEHGRIGDCNNPFEILFKTNKDKAKKSHFASLEHMPEALKALHPENQSDSMQGSFLTLGVKEINATFEDGTERKLKVKLQAVVNESGNRIGIAGSIEDTSQLKQAIEERDLQRERFALMLDMAPVAIATLDAEDRIIQANRTMHERLGIAPQELKKLSFYQLFSDSDKAAKAAKILHKNGRLHGFQAILKGKSAELHPSELYIDVIDKARQEYLCWIADTSDKQYQQDKFESLLQHSSMPMAVLGEKGFNQLNKAACEFFAISEPDDLFGFYPYSPSLNCDEQQAQLLKAKLDAIKLTGQAQSVLWQHKSDDNVLDCQATYVPMYKGKEFDSILCIWMDLSALKKADEARMQAINLHQATERELEEKQQLLKSSQDQLATKVKSLHDTQTKLQAAEVDLSEKQSEISDLQQAHQSLAEHLSELQNQYSESRQSLEQSQKDNVELEAQLAHSSKRVSGLEKQRNQIADELQYSEKKYQNVQKELAQSEEKTRQLQAEQLEQQQKMAEYAAQIDDLKGSIKQKDSQIQDVSGQINTLQSQLNSSGQTSEKLRQLLLNQRKASEQAEQQRRALEQTYHQAASELSNKARQIDHLQHEMQKFEEMSNQQKGDMQKQQALLQQELEAKQEQLLASEQALEEIKRQSESDKAEHAAQQEHLLKLQHELEEVERHSEEQQQKMSESDQYWRQQQRELQEALRAKQQALLEKEQVLNESKQQTEAEKAERARQQEIFEKLQHELQEMEQRSAQQQQKIKENDQQWQQRQLALKQEVEAKQQELQQTRQLLNDNQQQADAEKHERLAQQQKLEQLKVELSDVELRAAKQREMMHGSDEQWRQHHAEIEQQKIQLQDALREARQQNEQMQQKLAGSLQELKQAESQVSETLSGEQKLQAELNKARQDADELQQRIRQQEQQELKLQQQLSEQQQALRDRETNINKLESEQKHLTDTLKAVQQEYTSTQKNLSAQDTDHAKLAEQLTRLEQELSSSKAQLDSKENALQAAQQKLESSQAILAEQEKALLAAHQEELKIAQSEESNIAPKAIPEFAHLPMPSEPNVWFDLLPYLQKNAHAGPLPIALNGLMEELDAAIKAIDSAVDADQGKEILLNTRKLVTLLPKINSAPLNDLATRLESDCQRGQVDNISIFWTSAKESLMTTLRVIYSHLHG